MVAVMMLGTTGDELISDSFDMKEVEDGFFYEVEGKVGTDNAALSNTGIFDLLLDLSFGLQVRCLPEG